jgi:hypothetical protein
MAKIELKLGFEPSGCKQFFCNNHHLHQFAHLIYSHRTDYSLSFSSITLNEVDSRWHSE